MGDVMWVFLFLGGEIAQTGLSDIRDRWWP
jgi:hypothetical protein